MATVTPNHAFDAVAAAKVLRDSMKGIGTKTDDIIDVLVSHNNHQRQAIKVAFRTSYGKDLESELGKESAVSGNFKDVIEALLAEPAVFAAREFRRAIKGAGTDEMTLIELLVSLTNHDIEHITRAFKTEYKRDLLADIKDDTSGQFRDLLLLQAQGKRDASRQIDMHLVEEDIRVLEKAGKAGFNKDNKAVVEIMGTRSHEHIHAVFEKALDMARLNLVDYIQKHSKGDLKDAYDAIVKYSVDPDGFFADRLHRSMKGMGTDEHCLIRVLVMRSEIDLAHIQSKFKYNFGKTLESWVSGDTSKHFRKILLKLLNAA